jgi:hypothetical protein
MNYNDIDTISMSYDTDDHTNTDSLSSYYSEDDENDDDTLYEMYRYDYSFLKYKQNKKYYIGLATIIDNIHLLAHTVTPKTYSKYSYNDVLLYLHTFSIMHIQHPKIDIFQLFIVKNVYTVVIKTHWIRLIQRHWKKYYKTKTEILKKRAFSGNHFQNTIFNKYNTQLPQWKGMLNYLCLVKCQ